MPLIYASEGMNVEGRPTPRDRYPESLSVIIPVFNEQGVLPLLFSRLKEVLGRLPMSVEVIFVNDGSLDSSLELLIEASKSDPRIRIIDLSRNFGHQIAISAGLDHCTGEAAIIMDADLQDPPEVTLEMIELWRAGWDVVYGQRAERLGESKFKSMTARMFYRLLNRIAEVEIPPDVGDFRLVDRRVIRAFRRMPERDRFVRGMFAWLGFRQCSVRFDRQPRAAGLTKYPFPRMMALALDAALSFSDAPLRVIVRVGIFVSGLAIVAGIVAAILRVIGVPMAQGWTSLMVVITFLMGVNFLLIGIVALYVGRIYEEVKGRPLYLVRDHYTFSDSRDGRVANRASGTAPVAPELTREESGGHD
jgi:polyisoprenyl-phosphate glycosyltransferase